MKKIFLMCLSGFLAYQTAQAQLKSNQWIFAPISSTQGSPYRTAQGTPAESYWQNRVDYKIQAELDEKERRIAGKVKIIYTNNSPHALPFLWLQLDQNRFRSDSRGELTQDMGGENSRFKGGNAQGGINITDLKTTYQGKATAITPLINDTRMQVRLAEPLAPKASIELEMAFAFYIPMYGADRMGIFNTAKGDIFEIAQWYPRMAVYDDVRGWNNEPYLGTGEFYCEYGDIEYAITAPADHIVVGSGALQNASEVLTKAQIERMEKAKQSDQTVAIITPEEAGDPTKTRPNAQGKATWRFKMTNTRDVAWASSKSFIWDAARINLPSKTPCLAQSAYPQEVANQKGWLRSTEYTKAAIEHYSTKWFEYPYPNAVNVAGVVGGMEYPGVSFCEAGATSKDLWGVTDHEFGHNWFPMIVGTNERLHPWLDEGFNQFINHYSTLAFNKGEYPSYMEKRGFEMAIYILPQLSSPKRESIATYPDVVQPNTLGMTAYFKPALGMYLLREVVLGEERFDYAFRHYIKTWAFKHPTPDDFFRCMENASGENLSWFWRTWFYGTGTIDLAIGDVTANDNEAVITILKKGEVPMPVWLELTENDGTKTTVKLPVEIWQRGNEWTFKQKTKGKLKAISLHKGDYVFPDTDPSNNEWAAKQ